MAGFWQRPFTLRRSRASVQAATIIVITCFGWLGMRVCRAAAFDDDFKAGRSVAKAEHPASESAAKTADPAKPDPADIEFFEKKVRPILQARCQECHGSQKQKGGLRLDARAGALAGGSTGPAVVPGNPEESLLVDAINYGEDFQMPPKSKLPPEEIATLTDWVRRGAPWGVEIRTSSESPGAARIPGVLSKQEFQAHARYWSFQPLKKVAPPAVTAAHAGWARNPIDCFILAALDRHNLVPAREAGKRTLIRRLFFDLTGLPPQPEDVETFLNDQGFDAYERLVDRLLASPHYGERWARHWLDLVRYAETAGHEFDYEIPNAFRYRDYVIRALNLDVPYDQFVVEHLSGDLLVPPRRHPVDGYNESQSGPGSTFWVKALIRRSTSVKSKCAGSTTRSTSCRRRSWASRWRAPDATITSSTRSRPKIITPLRDSWRSSRHQQAFLDPPERIGRLTGKLRELKEKLRAIVAIRARCAAGTSGEPGRRNCGVSSALQILDGCGKARKRVRYSAGPELRSGIRRLQSRPI